MDKPIDFVITWVDQNDKVWQQEKAKHSPDSLDLNSELRYRDLGTLKYWFRAVEKHAPWVNKIYFVTYGHVPEWLNVENEKLHIVKHEDYIPKEYLPTFSSHPIEFSFHKIEGLSEQFVYFNDDVFLNKDVTKEDFFKNGLPRDFGIFNPISPLQEVTKIVFNDIFVINKHFNKKEITKGNFSKFFSVNYGKHNLRNLCLLPWPSILGFYNDHMTASFLKSTFQEVWSQEYDLLHETSTHKFRDVSDVNQYLIRYWQICKGQFEPQSMKFGQYFSLEQLSEAISDIQGEKHKLICLNDDSENIEYENAKKIVNETFNKKYPIQSKYEK